MLAAILRRVNEDNEHLGYLSVLERLDGCVDERLTSALLEKARDPGLKPACIGQILDTVFQFSPEQARNFAESLLMSASTGDNGRDRAVIAGRFLALHTDDASWSVLRTAMEADQEFGCALIGRIAESTPGHGAVVVRKLSEPDLAMLYLWIERHFPAAPARQYGAAVAMTTRHMVELMHNEVLVQLRDRGTAEACEALRHLMHALPEQEWLAHTLAAAGTAYRIQSWNRPHPREVLDLVRRTDARLVDTPDQLLEVLAESLDRL